MAAKRSVGALPSWVAIGLLAVYAAVGIVMLVEARHDPTLWGREIHLFDALTPLATGAVGWVFGREVHRKAAAEYRRDAVNGHKLAGKVKLLGALTTGDPQDHLGTLVSQAASLFPETTNSD